MGRWMAVLEKTFPFKAGVKDPFENLMKVGDSPPQKKCIWAHTQNPANIFKGFADP